MSSTQTSYFLLPNLLYFCTACSIAQWLGRTPALPAVDRQSLIVLLLGNSWAALGRVRRLRGVARPPARLVDRSIAPPLFLILRTTNTDPDWAFCFGRGCVLNPLRYIATPALLLFFCDYQPAFLTNLFLIRCPIQW